MTNTLIRKNTIPRQDRTPQALLSEAGAHTILGYQLAQASIVTSQVFDAQVGRAGGLRRVEFTLLALVQGNPDATARQLARALAVTPPNVAILLDRLQSRGLLSRERSTDDARMQHVRLTRTGTALVLRSVRLLQDGERAALATLSAAEHAMLLELLHKVALARGRPDPAA